MLFHFFMVNQILAVQNFIQQYHEGLIPKVVLIASLDFLAQLLSIRGGAKYWAETSGIFASIVAEAINAHLGNFTKPPYVYQPPRFDDLGTVAGRSA